MYSEMDFLDQMMGMFLVFNGAEYCFHSGCTILHSYQQYTGVTFLHLLPGLVILGLFVLFLQ